MADEPVGTEVRTADGWLEFQEYFVRRRQEPDVLELRFAGLRAPRPTPEVLDALAAAEAIVIAPSNPLVSVGPILAVPGHARGHRRGARAGRPGRGGLPDRRRPGAQGPGGPDARARSATRRAPWAWPGCYAGLCDVFVLDAVDAALAPAVEALGSGPSSTARS